MRGSVVTTLLYFLGMLLVFVGERMVASGTWRYLSLVGLLVLGAAMVWRALRARGAADDRKRVERSLLTLEAVGLLALILYFLQSDALASLWSWQAPLEKKWPRLAVALYAIWPSLWLVAAVPTILVELAYAAVARAPRLEMGRLRDALLSGLGLACALIFAFTVTYVATARDKKADLSYFRTAKPGEATRKIVRTLDQPLEVSLFFPPASEVGEEVAGFFQDLEAESKQIHVRRYDHAADPLKAKELGVTGNGSLVMSRGTRRQQMSVGTELEQARSKLQNLDLDVQRKMLVVARPGRTVYFVTGHGERGGETGSENDKRATIRDLREAMSQQGFALRELSSAQGLATDVPGDAGLVLLIGPEKALLAEETASLLRYVERGGRLLLAIDPETGLDLKELLAPLGIKYTPTLLANDQVYARRTYQAGDRGNLVSGSFSSHPSISTLGKLGMRSPVIFPGTGYFEEVSPKPAGVSVNFTVHALGSTWADTNGNFAIDSDEKRKAWELVAAVSRERPDPGDKDKDKDKGKKLGEEGRVIVVGDADVIADGVVANPGNAYFVLDGVKWLLGEEAIAGEVSSEVDTPISHTRKQDVVWFYGSIFVVPALVLGVGFLVTRRRRKGKAKEAA